MSFAIYTPDCSHHRPASWLFSLDLPETPVDAHMRINNGLRATLLQDLSKLAHLDEQTLCRMAGIDRNTYQRRLNSPARKFSPEQSARIYTLARVLTAAVRLFDDDTARMAAWLIKPAKALGGRKPAELLSTPAGAEAVLNLVGRLEYGVIS